MMTENIIINEITKELVERWVDESGEVVLSDTQWEAVKDEIEGRIENYIDNLLEDVVLDIREGAYDE